MRGQPSSGFNHVWKLDLPPWPEFPRGMGGGVDAGAQVSAEPYFLLSRSPTKNSPVPRSQSRSTKLLAIASPFRK